MNKVAKKASQQKNGVAKKVEKKAKKVVKAPEPEPESESEEESEEEAPAPVPVKRKAGKKEVAPPAKKSKKQVEVEEESEEEEEEESEEEEEGGVEEEVEEEEEDEDEDEDDEEEEEDESEEEVEQPVKAAKGKPAKVKAAPMEEEEEDDDEEEDDEEEDDEEEDDEEEEDEEEDEAESDDEEEPAKAADTDAAPLDFFVGNLPAPFNELQAEIEAFMKKKKINVQNIRGFNKQFCFMTIDGAQKDAMSALNGVQFQGSMLRIDAASNTPKKTQTPGGSEPRIVVFDVDPESVTAEDLMSATDGSDGVVIASKGMGFVTLKSAADVQALAGKGSITVNGCTMKVEMARARAAPGARGGRTDSASCFSCGESGHKSFDCPSGGGARGGGGNSGCFKCGEQGHKSFDCPSGGGGRGRGGRGRGGPRGGARGGRGGRGGAAGGGGGCFKCGEDGHFSRECPN